MSLRGVLVLQVFWVLRNVFMTPCTCPEPRYIPLDHRLTRPPELECDDAFPRASKHPKHYTLPRYIRRVTLVSEHSVAPGNWHPGEQDEKATERERWHKGS
jgi:hypothetical protein